MRRLIKASPVVLRRTVSRDVHLTPSSKKRPCPLPTRTYVTRAKTSADVWAPSERADAHATPTPCAVCASAGPRVRPPAARPRVTRRTGRRAGNARARGALLGCTHPVWVSVWVSLLWVVTSVCVGGVSVGYVRVEGEGKGERARELDEGEDDPDELGVRLWMGT